MKERLDSIFKNVNYWLNFSEVKNGTLFAFDIALLACINNLFKSVSICFNYSKVVYIIICLSLFITLLSFSPILKKYNNTIRKNKKDIQNENILFYRDLARMDKEHLLDLVNKSYCKADEKDHCELQSQYVNDIADEILINSKIATRKYLFFRIALFINLIGVLLIAIDFIFGIQVISK